MAISIKISVHTIGAMEAQLHLEPRWWPADELCRDPRFKHTNQTGSYGDWDAELSEEEFSELHERYRPLATGGVWSDPAWQKRIQPQLRILDAVLDGGLGTISCFHVCAFEWDSGL
jgi:hypothetical protein